MATTRTGYVNGSDLLLFIGDKAIGNCTSHTLTLNSETKDRAVKPVATASISAGLWKKKGVTGLSINISAEGLIMYDETEYSINDLYAAWHAGQSITAECHWRGNTDPYIVGNFVITSLEQKAGAGEDATYSLTLENDGEPTMFDAISFEEDSTTP